MARRKFTLDDESQMYLLDVENPDAAKIKRAARNYWKIRDQRADLKQREKNARDKVLELVKDSGVEMVDGEYRVRVGTIQIVVTPQTEKIKISEARDGADEEELEDAEE